MKPLDEELFHEIGKKFSKIVTIEDGVIDGGFGSAVLEFFADNNYKAEVLRLGIPDEFIEHGTPEELYSKIGSNAEGVLKSFKEFMKTEISAIEKEFFKVDK